LSKSKHTCGTSCAHMLARRHACCEPTLEGYCHVLMLNIVISNAAAMSSHRVPFQLMNGQRLISHNQQASKHDCSSSISIIHRHHVTQAQRHDGAQPQTQNGQLTTRTSEQKTPKEHCCVDEQALVWQDSIVAIAIHLRNKLSYLIQPCLMLMLMICQKC